MNTNDKLFKTLKAGLGNGLRFSIGDCPADLLQGLSTDVEEAYGIDGDGYPINLCKPHLFPLSMLTKPITIKGFNDGKEFVPITELLKNSNFNTDVMSFEEQKSYVGTLCDKYFTTVRDSDLMDQWHINWRELDEDQFINAAESKVYEL